MRAAGLLLLVAGAARADLVRGTVKVDVRDQKGAAVAAEVEVVPEEGAPALVKRVGEVYVAEGVVEGVWGVKVNGVAADKVRVKERRTSGVVVVLGPEPGKKKAPTRWTVGPDERDCDGDNGGDGVAIELVGFAKGGLAAGRVEVKRGGKALCAATIAGGGATLKLPPGDYDLFARFVGGQSATTHLRFGKSDRAPPSIVLRAK